jgi:hypothetical protein
LLIDRSIDLPNPVWRICLMSELSLVGFRFDRILSRPQPIYECREDEKGNPGNFAASTELLARQAITPM